jgi:hypothetical protein
MAVANDRLAHEISSAIDVFLSETNKRDAENRVGDANVQNLRRDLESLASAVNAKGRDLRAQADVSPNDASATTTTYYRSVNGRPVTPQVSMGARSGPSTPARHTHVHDDAQLVRKWSTPTVGRSKLLSGSSALRHLPGAQYCIDAGLHHHHHTTETVEKQVRRQATSAPRDYDAGWFTDMERKLKALADQLSSLCGAPDQSRLALLLRHLQELNGLYQDKTRRDADVLRALEIEWERRARAILDDCHRVMGEDRARWLQFIAQLREAYERDLARLEAELRGKFEVLVAQMRDAHSREVGALNDEIARLRRLLAEAQRMPLPPAPVITQSGPMYPDLSGRVRELTQTVQDRDDEIARLRRTLAEQHFVVKVKEPRVTVPFEAHKASEGRSQVWSSGAVARAYLNKTNPFPRGSEIDVEKGDVKVFTSDGLEADPAKFTVKYVVN